MPEWPQNISFCPDLGAITTSDLSRRIATTLFGCADNSGVETLLKRRYAQMRGHVPENVPDGEAWNLDGEYSDCINNGSHIRQGRTHIGLKVCVGMKKRSSISFRELLVT